MTATTNLVGLNFSSSVLFDEHRSLLVPPRTGRMLSVEYELLDGQVVLNGQ